MEGQVAGPDAARSPAVARWIAVTVVVAAVAAGGVTALEPPGAVEPDVLAVLVALTIALLTAAVLPLRLPSRPGEPSTLATLEEAVLLAMLVVVPLGIVPWLVLLGTLLHQVHARVELRKLAFNTALAGLGASAAVAVVLALRDVAGEDLLPRLAVAAAGATAASVVELIGLAGLYARLDGRSLRDHLDLGGFLGVALALDVVVGLLLAAAVVADPLLAWLDVVAIAVLGLVLRDLGGDEPAAPEPG